MKFAEDVIIKPIMTEKSYENIAIGKYTFEVALTATKVDIKNAVEELFGVKVKSVNTLRYDGKNKRVGVHQGKLRLGKSNSYYRYKSFRGKISCKRWKRN